MLVHHGGDLPNDAIVLQRDYQDVPVVAQELPGALRVDLIVKDVISYVLKRLNIVSGKSFEGRRQSPISRAKAAFLA